VFHLCSWSIIYLLIIVESGVDGALFIKLTREDLKDILPHSFALRKMVWDYLEYIVSASFDFIFFNQTLSMVC